MSLTDVDLRTTGFGRTGDGATNEVALGEAVRAGAKRAMDVVLSLVLLVLVLPVALVVAVLVARDGGPVLFRQERVGRGGRTFRMFKFRSMAADAEARLVADPELHRRYVENDFKLPADEDPRITSLGRVLRATSLDELPQLLNVLRGDMSLVGPRPIVVRELDEYVRRGGEEDYLAVRPGMTGPWQAGGRSSVGYDERVALDRQYRREAGVTTDLVILVQTVGAVLRREGAH